MLRREILLLPIVGYCLLTSASIAPGFSWDTIGSMAFFHSSNKSGDFTDEAIELMAQFRMVTIEKWQSINVPGHATTMEENIVSTLKRVKAVNNQTCTIFYYNSVCDFPVYGDLYPKFDAMKDGWLINKSGSIIWQNCAGWNHMPVFDFSLKKVRDLWASECINVTQSGVVDGCFADRAVDGTPANQLNNSKKEAYIAGHYQVLQDLQSAIGQGPLISNHAYGPPHDNLTGVRASMIEGCSPSESSIKDLQICAQNKRICQCHATGNILDALSSFLIGAYSGDGYASYFGFGPWNSAQEYSESWANGYWPYYFDKPLGSPVEPAKKVGDIYHRNFTNLKGITQVSFNITSKKGSIIWAGDNTNCSDVEMDTGISGHDITPGHITTNDYTACCQQCWSNLQCTAWTWYSHGSKQCHFHDSDIGSHTAAGRISGNIR